MAHVIGETCIGTKQAACVDVCPVDCIHPRKDEPEFAAIDKLHIDPEACIDCGLCVDECPVKAIYPDHALPPEWHKYIQLNKDYYATKKG